MGSNKDPSPVSLSWDPLGALLEADLSAPQGNQPDSQRPSSRPRQASTWCQGHRLRARPSRGTSQGLAETGGRLGLPQILSTTPPPPSRD